MRITRAIESTVPARQNSAPKIITVWHRSRLTLRKANPYYVDNAGFLSHI